MPLRHVPTCVGALAVAALLAAAACSKNPEAAKQEYLKSGDRFMEQKKYREAIVQYRNAIQQDPRFGDARLKLAKAYTQTGELQGAFREYVRAADLLPTNLAAQVNAATFLLAAQQFDDARARAEKALAIDKKNVTAQIILGNSLAGLKDLDNALKEIEQAVRLDPKSAFAYTSLASVQAARGSSKDAEDAFQKAVQTNPTRPDVHLALANFLWAAGRQPEAEGALKKALELEPKNPMANRALAAFYL